MDDILTYYGEGVELVDWYAEDGHHSDIADYNNDPLIKLITEEEEDDNYI